MTSVGSNPEEATNTAGTAYADPGLQADKLKRYPIDTPAHVRSALSYIGQKDNAAKYNPADLTQVKAAVYRAAKSFGIDAYGSVAANAIKR